MSIWITVAMCAIAFGVGWDAAERRTPAADAESRRRHPSALPAPREGGAA